MTISSLVELEVRSQLRVVGLLPTSTVQVRQLITFGIVPGTELEVLQTFPTYVLQIGYLQLALDYEIAKNILVTPLVQSKPE